MSYPYGQGQGGYPGYPGQQQAGYPQQPGYPQQAGYPQQQSYPQPGGGYDQMSGYSQQPGYPQTGMPMPNYSSAGGLPYAAQPAPIGFGGVATDTGFAPPPSVAMPSAQPSYGVQNQPGYPTGGGGYPGQPQPAAGGYPGQPQPAAGGYPGQPQPGAGYPGQPQPGAGYPGQPSAAGAGYQPYPGQPGGPPPQQPPARPQPPSATSGSLYPNMSTGAPARTSPSMPTKAMAGLSIKSRQETGTVRPAAGFDPESDCKILRKAMKGFGTDEKAIIDVLCYRSNNQRQELRTMFKTMFGRDLLSDLKSELGGNFEDCILALMQPAADYDAKELRNAIKGLGTDEDCLIEIMCTRSNRQMAEINATYKKLFKKTLEDDLRSDTSGHFRKLLISMSAGGRREDQSTDAAKAKRDAQALYEAGEKRMGTDESAFLSILAVQSYEQLQMVFREYHQISKRSIEQSIKREMSGDLEKGLLTIVKCVMDRSAYFAEKLYKSMKGAGTKDSALIRVVVTRSEVDMLQIKECFQKTYGKTLDSFIEGDCSGDYKRCLMALVRNK